MTDPAGTAASQSASAFSGWRSNKASSVCAFACTVYRPSTKTAARSFSTTPAPAEPVNPLTQASRSLASGRYSF
ncbi:hypothetical protein D3C73_848900 [compost metagenome]